MPRQKPLEQSVMRAADESGRWTRRGVLGATGVAGATLLAGCLGGDGSSDGDGGSPGGADEPPGGDDGSPGGDGGSTTAGGGDPTTDSGAADGPGDGSDGDAAVGELIVGDHVSMMVESVRPVPHVRNFAEMPRTDEEGVYGAIRTVEDLVERRAATEGSSLYAVELAVLNTSDRFVDTSVVSMQSEAQPFLFEVFMATTQTTGFGSPSRSDGRLLVPGELVRGDLVFALEADPSEYALVAQSGTYPERLTQQVSVDLSRGAPAAAPFSSSVDALATGETAVVGDFELTIHAAEYVASVADSPYQEYFGPREGFEYLVVDASATRRTDAMIGQDWAFGVRDTDGSGASWRRIYQDVYELNRRRFEELDVGETSSHTTFAFPIEEGYRPAYLATNVDGPVESDVFTGAQTFRALWQIG